MLGSTRCDCRSRRADYGEPYARANLQIFNFGIKRGIVEINPAAGVDNPGAERQRDRVFSEEEMRTLWDTLGREPARIAAIFRLGLLTAQRRGEILGMRWAELDLDAGWWTIPAERARTGWHTGYHSRRKPSKLLCEIKAGSRDDAPGLPGGRIGQPLANLQKPLRRVKRASGLDFKFHDLRRTAASHMTGIGVSRLVVSKLLNHVERGITAVYDRHSYDAEKRAALIKWEHHLSIIVAGENIASNVIVLKG